jgi:hypothetical protein
MEQAVVEAPPRRLKARLVALIVVAQVLIVVLGIAFFTAIGAASVGGCGGG